MADPLKPQLGGQIPFFLENFLSKPASALPKGAQWILVFEGAFNSGSNTRDYPEILPVQAILKGTRLEPRTWEVEQAINTTIERDYQQNKGCLFVQAVQIPGENNQVNPEGFQQNGYIRTTIGAGRDAFENLQISFLQTNVSFVDNVIRPWVIATAHLGLIARDGLDNYRCNISFYRLGVQSNSLPPYVAMKYTFYGVCPINVSSEEYNYTQTSNPINRETTFIYHYYTVETPKDIPSILNNNTQNPIPFSTPIKNANFLR
jgi:hypothetical protein